jgi:hypothetical protein
MLDPATIDPDFEPRAILSPEGLRSEHRNPGYIQILEATHIHRIGGKYVLLYSAGDFDDGNYKIGVAYSDTLIPPEGQTYQKALIADPGGVWGNPEREDEVCYLLQSQTPAWPNYCGHLVNGPGIGNLVEKPDGGYDLIFHGRMPGLRRLHGQGRYVWRMPLEVDIRDDRPMHEWIRPARFTRPR